MTANNDISAPAYVHPPRQSARQSSSPSSSVSLIGLNYTLTPSFAPLVSNKAAVQKQHTCIMVNEANLN